MNSLEELARETIELIVSMQKKGIKNETIRMEIDKLKDEGLKMFFLTAIESLEAKSYIFN